MVFGEICPLYSEIDFLKSQVCEYMHAQAALVTFLLNQARFACTTIHLLAGYSLN